MVSSIVPGAAGANALGVDQRLTRTGSQAAQWRETPTQGDRVELSSGSLAASRESVRAGLVQVHEALAVGSEAQAMLVKVQGLARGGSQADLDALLAQYSARVDAAAKGGADVVSGKDVIVQAEPSAPAVTIAGVDLRLGGSTLSIGADAQADDPSLATAAQKSLDTLQTAMGRLVDSARALEAHQGFLGAAEAASVRGDLDADGARLMALQVRQGLEQAGVGAIANVEPQAVLSLFKA